MEKSDVCYKELSAQLQMLSLICFKLLSYESEKLYFLSWLDRLDEVSVKPLLEKEENDLYSIDSKLMKLDEIEKRLFDKCNDKERIINNANSLITSIESTQVKASIQTITLRWDNICLSLKEIRKHVDNVAYAWRQFTNMSEHLEQWLSMNLTSIKASLEHSSIDSVKLEIEMIRNLQNELDLKHHEKDILKELKANLSEYFTGKACHVANMKMADIEKKWLELKCSLQERVDHLALLIDEVEMENINDMVISVSKCVRECEDELQRYDKLPGKSCQEIDIPSTLKVGKQPTLKNVF